MRYRLPEVLGGGECTIVERDPALTLMGKPAHVVEVTAAGVSTYLVVQQTELVEREWPWEMVTEYGATVGTQPIATRRVNLWVRESPPNPKTLVATLRPDIARSLGQALGRAADAAEKEQS